MKLPDRFHLRAIQIASYLIKAFNPAETEESSIEQKHKSHEITFEFKSANDLQLAINADLLIHDLNLKPEEITNEQSSEAVKLFKAALIKLNENKEIKEIKDKEILIIVQVGELLKTECRNFLEKYKKVGLMYSKPYKKLDILFNLLFNPEILQPFSKFTDTEKVNAKHGITNFILLNLLILDIMRLKSTEKSEFEQTAVRDCDLLLKWLSDEKLYDQPQHLTGFLNTVIKQPGANIPQSWKKPSETLIEYVELNKLLKQHEAIEVSAPIFNLVMFQDADGEVSFKRVQPLLIEIEKSLTEYSKNRVILVKNEELELFQKTISTCSLIGVFFENLNSKSKVFNMPKAFIERLRLLPPPLAQLTRRQSTVEQTLPATQSFSRSRVNVIEGQPPLYSQLPQFRESSSSPASTMSTTTQSQESTPSTPPPTPKAKMIIKLDQNAQSPGQDVSKLSVIKLPTSAVGGQANLRPTSRNNRAGISSSTSETSNVTSSKPADHLDTSSLSSSSSTSMLSPVVLRTTTTTTSTILSPSSSSTPASTNLSPMAAAKLRERETQQKKENEQKRLEQLKGHGRSKSVMLFPSSALTSTTTSSTSSTSSGVYKKSDLIAQSVLTGGSSSNLSPETAPSLDSSSSSASSTPSLTSSSPS